MSEKNMVDSLLFDSPGPKNTRDLLEFASRRFRELSLKSVVIATSTGRTAEDALQYFDPKQVNVVAVRYVTGFKEPGVQPMPADTERRLLDAGVRIVTAAHAFGSIGRGIRNKLDTYQIDEIMAYTLRMFGQGVKVGVEISYMAADNGAIRPDEDVLTISGSGRGADTALIVKPSNSHQCLELRIRQVLAKPWGV